MNVSPVIFTVIIIFALFNQGLYYNTILYIYIVRCNVSLHRNITVFDTCNKNAVFCTNMKHDNVNITCVVLFLKIT